MVKSSNRTLTDGAASGERGFSLVEVMVAATIFVIVALVAYAIYDAGNKSYKKGEEAADQQQQVRVAFDRMVSDIRLAGYDFNLDGNQTTYLDSPDEQIEFAGPAAITVRANFDYADSQGGREYDASTGPACTANQDHSGYESCVDWVNDQLENALYSQAGVPIVTTGNDEIVTYALVSANSSRNTGTIDLKLDLSRYRDAVKDDAGRIYSEETASGSPRAQITGVDLTQDNPPYTLYRFTFDDQGNVVRTPIADNIKELNFLYYGRDGKDYYCSRPEADGSCLTSNRLFFRDVLGGDDISTGDRKRREARAAIRKITVELIGLTAHQDWFYTDPQTDTSTGDQATKHFRKFRLTSDLTPPNLGKVGQLDLGAQPPSKVMEVRLCTGQCHSVYVSWKANAVEEQILGYVVELFEGTDKIASVFGGTVDPRTGRVFMQISVADDPDIRNDKIVTARVYAKNVNGANGPDSDPTPARTIQDRMRSDPPRRLVATGYSLSNTNYWDAPSERPKSNATTILPTASTSDPQAAQTNQITLTWTSPAYVMDVTNTSDPDNSRTNDVTLSTYAPYISDTDPLCERWGPFDKNNDGITTQTPTNEYRTQEHESHGLWHKYGQVPSSSPAVWEGGTLDTDSSAPKGFNRGRFLIFRSERPNFEPRDSDLIAIVDGSTYVDQSEHVYSYPCSTCGTNEENQGVFQHTKRVLENCKTYYYRIRMADDCWDGQNPAGASASSGDFTNTHLSAFWPPIDYANKQNFDYCGGCGPVGDQANAATMGYAIPGRAGEAYRAEKPKDFGYEEDPDNPGSGHYWLRFDAAKRATTQSSGDSYKDGYVRNTLTPNARYPHITAPKYRVFMHKSATTAFTIPDTCDGLDDSECSGNLSIRLWQKIVVNPSSLRDRTIWHDDENGDATIQYFEDETATNVDPLHPETFTSDLYFRKNERMSERNANKRNAFEVVTVQCRKGKDGDTSWDDGIDTTAYDHSVASNPIYLPCYFGEWAYAAPATWTQELPNADGDVGIDASNWPDSVVVSASDLDGDIKPCRARLILSSQIRGDRVATNWKTLADNGAQCGVPLDPSMTPPFNYTFTRSEIEDALNRMEGRDIIITAQVQERDTVIGCIGQASERVEKAAEGCIALLSQAYNHNDFTDNTSNWVPDNLVDCYQAIEWQLQEVCSNGNLTIRQIKVTTGNEGSNNTGLVRVWWHWELATDADPETNPVEIHFSNPPDGQQGLTVINLSPALVLGPLEAVTMRFEFSNGTDDLSMKSNNLEVVFMADRTRPDNTTENNQPHTVGPTRPVDDNCP